MSELVKLLDLTEPLNDVDEAFPHHKYVVILVSLWFRIKVSRRKRKLYYVAIIAIAVIDERTNDEESVDSG